MIRFVLLSVGLFISAGLFAQSEKTAVAKTFITENAEVLGLSKSDINEALISDMYTSAHNGVTHIYYNQARNGIPVYNAILTLNIGKKDEVIFHDNGFIPNIDAKINTHKSLFTPAEAIVLAATSMGVKNAESPVQLKSRQNGFLHFAKTSFSDSDIRARQVYYPSSDDLKLTWEVNYGDKNSTDSWRIQVDAVTGEMITAESMTIYCKIHSDEYHSHSSSCRKDQEVSVVKALETAVDDASYLVYPLPLESPLFGQQQMVTSPALPGASPFGWHDIDAREGPEYTITRGNNVHAFADENNDRQSESDEPDGGADLVFDFVHKTEEIPDSNRNADVVNNFYVNNMIHDITYLMGFDEPAGNFQFNNFGNGGLDSDYVFAHSLDGQGTNNASFEVVPDGVNGTLNMFRFDVPTSTLFRVTEPQELNMSYDFGTAAGGWGFDLTYSSYDINAKVVPAYDNAFQNANNVCRDVENIQEVNGNIALIYRGTCEFGAKALNAQNAGAVAVIICNVPGAGNDPSSDGNEPMGMGGGVFGPSVQIPVLSLGFQDCNNLVVAVEAGTTVTANIRAEAIEGPGQLSSGFDNVIILHEYGHGISTRLTGGPSSLCLGNDEQMGEGWSDFFALALTVEPGDLGSDARNVGNYPLGQEIEGSGFRRYPYSTDMSINPQTFKDIKATSAPHDVGEIWVNALWDIFWSYIDKYGYDEDWTNTESGNFRAVQLVIDGMKMQGCNPGLMRGRDALLAADMANTGGDNECLLWEAFARRGMGFFADGGSANNRNDGSEDFNPLPICQKTLKIYKNIPELLSVDSETTVELIVANHIDSTVSNVIVSDELPEGMSFVDGTSSREAAIMGNTIFFEYDSLATNEWDTIRYNLIADNSSNSFITFNNSVETGDEINEWERLLIQGSTNIFRLNSSSTFPTYSGESCWHVPEVDQDQESIIRFNDLTVTGERPALRFWHRINTEFARNGGFVEISSDGVIWTDVRDKFIRNGYECPLFYTTFAIPSLQAFSGRTETYIDSYIDLSSYRGETISVRFRFGCWNGGVDEEDDNDETFPFDSGWFIDDVDLIDIAVDETTACISAGGAVACTDAFRSVLDPQMLSSTEEASVGFSELKVYPNPASQLVTLEIMQQQSGYARIQISDVSGRLVHRENRLLNASKNLLNIVTSEWQTGVYFVRVQNDNGIATQKLIINK